jgi:hypothetical protein
MKRELPARFAVVAMLCGTTCIENVRAAAVFTYISGPHGCTQPPGYPDAALCTIPNETPLATFAIPPVGSTYVDANFGATVRILSGFGSNHGYATPSAFSANGQYVAVAQNGAQVNVVETAAGRVAYTNRPGNVTYDTVRWDASNDDVYYAISGTQVKKHQLSTNTTTVVRDYATDGHAFTHITGGGTGDTSKENWLSVFADIEHQVCALNLNTGATYCADYLAPAVTAKVGFSFIDFPNMAKGVDSHTGKRYVLLMANPAIAVFSVNETTGKLDFEFRGPEFPQPDFQASASGNNNDVCEPNETCFGAYHSDTFEDSDGQQYMAFVADLDSPCQREIMTVQLNKGRLLLHSISSGGGRTDVMPMDLCGGGPIELWLENHTGCARKSPYCVISTNYTSTRNPADLTTPINRTTHLSELMVMRGNGLEIRRVAQTRGIQFSNDSYWSVAKASISSDGGKVLWDSNFGYPNRGETVAMAYTGYGSTPGLSCDLNADGATNVTDAQIALNQATGKAPCTTGDLTQSGTCNVIDVQRVINTALGSVCKIGP